jgi:hypothetical protein
MSGLEENDPKLAAVKDKKTRRNLLDPSDPNPYTVEIPVGKKVRFHLEVINGPEGLIDLAIASDEPWLEPETSRLTLVGGEAGDCIFSAKPQGETKFANILFSWEGCEKTLCESVMIMRNLPSPAGGKAVAQGGTGGSVTAKSPAKGTRIEAVDRLVKFIDSCGGPDKFIDIEEEHAIFRKGGALELTLTEIESVLNRRCSDGGWTRQSRLTEKLTAMLREAAKDEGLIDHQAYNHIVNFAVKRRMPRRDADEHCVTLILDNAWRVKENFFDKWFSKKRRQYGL